jgi:hypothetical protein
MVVSDALHINIYFFAKMPGLQESPVKLRLIDFFANFLKVMVR